MKEEGTTETVNSTPDLDSNIEFEPIVADFAIEEEENTQKTEDVAADEEVQEKPEIPDTPLPIKAPELNEKGKKKAIEEGLKATEGDASGALPAAKAPVKPAQNVKVNLDLLENLMQLVGELVLTRNQLLQLKRNSETNMTGDISISLQRLNIITSELQEGVMKTRMQPINIVWSKFPRIIRDISKELNKKIRFVMNGEDTEMDRQMLEAIKDPLTHMIRNSVDHGIELPEERLAAGKIEEGTVTLSAYHEGGHIIIKIQDDGKGVNVEAVKAKAIEKGMLTEDEAKQMNERQISQFILHPGFSTAEKVTSISGRGVGMDVVVNSIQKIGGTLELNSEFGKGSEFLIKLPLTLAIMPVLLVSSANETFAIPQIMVSEIVKVGGRINNSKATKQNNSEQSSHSQSHKLEVMDGSPVLRLRGDLLPLISLTETLELSQLEQGSKENFIVVCEVGSSSFGIMVEKVYHTEEIVVKPKSKLVNDIEAFSGSTILGDGRVILIIDANGILKQSNIASLSDSRPKEKVKDDFDEDEISFLMFNTNDKTPKAIPLELVSRLEEIDYSKVENSGGAKVVQYRNKLMKLISIDEKPEIPEDEIFDTIVFTDRERVLGVYVKEILDIVKAPLDIKSASKKLGVLGSMVMKNKATEVVDISHFISKEFDDWLGHGEANLLDDNFSEQRPDNRKHILLVDDSSFFRKFMRPVILAAGYRVTTAQNGQEGLEMVTKYKDDFDVVISDIDMPIMNGVEFVKEAKKIAEVRDIPFVALSSHEEDDFDEDVKNMGFEKLVTKANRNKVVSLISEILEERKIASNE